MKKLLLVLAAIAAISLSSCSENTSPEESYTIRQLFPLKTGNSWTYDAIDYDSSGNVRSRDSIIITITGETTFNGKQAYIAVLAPEIDSAILFYDGDAIYSSEGSDPTPDIFLKLPTDVNKPIIVRDTTYSDSTRSMDQFVLKSKSTQVSVPAGTFKCYTMHEEYYYGPDSALKNESYSKFDLAPNVGLIHQQYITFFPDNKQRLRSEMLLRTYTVK